MRATAESTAECGSADQRGAAVVLREVLVGAGVEQRAHDRVAPVLGRDVQRGDVVVVRVRLLSGPCS
jgi:hypothetical protein